MRAVILYVTSVWALAQGVAQLSPVVGAPDGLARWFLVAAFIGFPFWIAFAWFYELTPQGIRRDSEAEPSESVARATGRKLDFWIIGVLAVAVVLLLTDRFVTHNEAADNGTAAISGKSVAVLPLVNESGDPNALYFSDGLSEAFIDALSQFPGLKVIARASSFHFRDSKDSVSVIGEKLGVAHLLEGSLQRAGDTVRISAELINTKDGTALWSQHYDRPYKNLFGLQDDITNAVATALKAKLLGRGTAQASQNNQPPSGNLAAYNAFLEGVFYSHRATTADQSHAAAAFARAVQLDPLYAAAWAELSFKEHDAALSANSGIAQALAKSREHAEKAMALAPNLALANEALGVVLLNESDWPGAQAKLRRALLLAPNKAGPKIDLAGLLATIGQAEQAVTLMQEAVKLDPLRAYSYFVLAQYLMPLGRLDEARTAIQKAIALQPESTGFQFLLAQIYVLQRNADAALAQAQKVPAEQFFRDFAVALALQIGTDRGAANAALKNLVATQGDEAASGIAEIYALRKEPDAMFRWLERARAANDPGLQSLLFDPFILPYRYDPRFAALSKELKLPVSRQ